MRMKSKPALIALTLLLCANIQAQQPSLRTSDDPRRVIVPPLDLSKTPALVIKGATLLDGYGNAPVRDSVVVIRGSQIEAAGPATTVHVPNDVARTIDATGMWMMPGMIDLHIHLRSQRGSDGGAYPNTLAAAGIRGTLFLQSLVRAGITAVVDRGTPDDLALRLKEAVARGLLVGPRVFWSGQLITSTGGHADEATADATGRWKPPVPDAGVYAADGADEFRKAVRIQIRKQADWIKVAAPFEKDEIAEAVKIAHSNGLRVAVDSFGVYTLMAIEAGVDSVEHPLDMRPEQIPLMVKHHTAWDPTLVPFEMLLAGGYPTPGIPGGGFYWTFARRFPISLQDSMEQVGKAYRAGVHIGVGTDVGSDTEVTYPAVYFRELELLRQSGLPVKAVLAAATRIGADNAGMGDKLGTIEAGKLADLLILTKDPEQDLANLRALRAVIAGGKVVEVGGSP